MLPRIEPLVGGRPPGNGVGAEGEIPFMVALHGEDDQSIREYRDGDDLRRIHWPATARTGDLMVRQEDRPARRRAMILLDPRAGAHQGHGAVELVRVGGLRGRLGRHAPGRARLRHAPHLLARRSTTARPR